MSNIWSKLNLKEQREILVSCAPASFEAAIAELENVSCASFPFGLRRHHVLACVCHQAGGDHAPRQSHREEGRGRCHNLDGLSERQFEAPHV